MNVLALAFAVAVALAEPVPVLEPIATGLANPISITPAGYDGPRLLPDPFLDIRSLVSSGGERGLLSVAFHPRYAQNGFFYVNYTDLNGNTVVARYSVSPADPNRANASSAVKLLGVNQPFA